MEETRTDAPRTLAECRRMFARATSPRILTATVAVLLIVRVALGGWRGADLVVVAVLIASQPPVEWAIHVFLLHAKPRTIRGRTIDLAPARGHRAHHADPRTIGTLFLQPGDLATFAVLWTLIFTLVLRDLRLGVTGGITVAALTLFYEWMHFVPHTRYRPRTALFRAPWRTHRLHHYKNERYWHGICTTFADHLFGTFKDKSEVETSPTCRDLESAYRTNPRP